VSGPHDDIQAELDRMGAGHGVDRELEQMKAELGQGSAPRQIEGAQAGNGAAAPGSTAQPAVSETPAADPAQAGDPE
jgi:phage shock protein A